MYSGLLNLSTRPDSQTFTILLSFFQDQIFGNVRSGFMDRLFLKDYQ